MQNTSPGPEGKEREGKRGKARQRAEYECRHFLSWPIVCMGSALEKWRHTSQSRQAWCLQSPFCSCCGLAIRNTLWNKGAEVQHPRAGLAETTLCTKESQASVAASLHPGLLLHGMVGWQFFLPMVGNYTIQNNISV